MTYATQYHFGNYQSPTADQTETTAQAVSRVRTMDEPPKRCQRNQKRPTEICTDSNGSNALLKCSFLPKLQETENRQACRKSKRFERDFYQSLSYLKEHYQLNSEQFENFEFPYNIALEIQNVQNQLKTKVRDWEEIQLIQDKGKVYFTSEERYNTGATLYYIPVIPLYRLSKIKKYNKAFRLLLSVYSYLYHIVDIPYYRQEVSYLYWMYEMFEQWANEDDEDEENINLLLELKHAEWIGDIIEKKIFSVQNLEHFKLRLKQFTAQDELDENCLMLAQNAYNLFIQFPNSNIMKNAQSKIIFNEYDEEEQEENTVTMDKYISFCAEAKGALFNMLFQSVNNELQEYGQIEEPAVIKYFTDSNISESNLDFEHQIFNLIEELIDLMNDL
ncbi:hypothetical protein LUD75_12875 [Epilithonimonas sp. JDS]|uniref:hypothetical protein n=1 Tax=Epilithonimonas sp. JDS TaxID=2902797 RepID=UPI001E38E8A4|nr:hypothetical protein [Epilithonimonas sp. JDS]MCD9855611.1 hypothetical protein [Epilithonimonas sp. JDS]